MRLLTREAMTHIDEQSQPHGPPLNATFALTDLNSYSGFGNCWAEKVIESYYLKRPVKQKCEFESRILLFCRVT